MLVVIHSFDFMSVFIPVKSCWIDYFLSDFLGFQDFFFKLRLSFDLKEADIVYITHSIHYLLKPCLILHLNLIKVGISF